MKKVHYIPMVLINGKGWCPTDYCKTWEDAMHILSKMLEADDEDVIHGCRIDKETKTTTTVFLDKDF